jgi:hypothetical protein
MPQIFIMNGPEKGRSIPFEADTAVLGRAPDNDIQVNDQSVSRRHLRIDKRGDLYFITDIQSKNGTYIGGTRIEPETEYEVKQGVPIAVGKVFMSIGKSCPDEILSVLDSVDLFKEVDEHGGTVVDRPLTARKNMELIHKVSGLLLQPMDVKELLGKMITAIMELLQRVDRGTVILADKKTGDISEVVSVLKSTREGASKPFSKTIVGRVLKEGKPISMVDTGSEEKVNLSESIQSMDIRSVMCVPLKGSSGIMGVIYLDSLRKPYGFRKEDLDLLVALSSPAALAIQNSLIQGAQKEPVQHQSRRRKTSP